MKLGSLCCAALLLPSSVLSQQKLVLPSNYCEYAGETLPGEIYTFEADEDAREGLRLLLARTGLEQNFSLDAANVPNAVAVIINGKRRILYNQEFMLNVKAATKDDWASRTVLAHEVGHHLQGHTLEATARPRNELEADRYAGFLLHGMGATLAQARLAVERYTSDFASETHPPKSARLAAVTNGWNASRELTRRAPSTAAPAGAAVAQTPIPETPVPRTAAPATPLPAAPTYLYRAVFPADPRPYYVTTTSDIVVQLPTGQVSLVGKQISSALPQFAWTYWTPYGSYGVDAGGKIWSQHPSGMPFQVGYITKP